MQETEPDGHGHATGASLLGREYDPVGKTLENPFPFYAQARLEEPIFYSEKLQAWVVTRYEDVKAILLAPDIFSSRDTLRPVVEFTPQVFHVLAQGYGFVPTIINTDGSEHVRFRTPLNHALRPARLKAMERQIREVADRLVDGFVHDGKADLVAQFAGPLAGEIILSMYGIPAVDLPQCKQWSDEAHALTASPLSPQRQLECAQSFVALQRYLAEIIDERKSNLGDDVVSALLTVRPADAPAFTLPELVMTLLGVLLAGHETTTNLIGNAIYLLLSQPEWWQYVCSHPEALPSVVEEVLRFDAPVPTFYRTAVQESRIRDVTIAEGDLLLLAYISANRDEEQFPRSDLFDLRRSPNRHVAFGHGVHFCVGASLARSEARIALEVLSRRLPSLRLPHQKFSHIPNLQFRGFERLEGVWDA